MPVMGHAFAGLAVAVIAQPRQGVSGRLTFWVPAMVALAYLPDIAAQLLQVAGLATSAPACHSIILAMPAAMAIAVLLRRQFRVGLREGFAVALFSIILHDLLDVLVGHHRLLLWPLSDRSVAFALGEIDLSMAFEMLVFGGVTAGLLALRWFWFRRGDRDPRACRWSRDHQGYGRQRVWGAAVSTALLLLAVVLTQYLRDLRERQVALAWTLIRQGQYPAALDVLDRAGRWPSTAPRGRSITSGRRPMWIWAAGPRPNSTTCDLTGPTHPIFGRSATWRISMHHPRNLLRSGGARPHRICSGWAPSSRASPRCSGAWPRWRGSCRSCRLDRPTASSNTLWRSPWANQRPL